MRAGSATQHMPLESIKATLKHAMTKRWCVIPLVALSVCFLARALVWLHFRDVDASAANLLKTFQQTPTRRYEAPPIVGKIESPICADADTAFALVSLLIVNGYEHDQYMQGMCKLGQAIRQFATIDTILLVAEVGMKLNSDAQIARCGWRVCFVSTIPGPPGHSNRYLEAKMYTKLRLWQLVQYQAVLYIDLDTLIVRPFGGIFEEHLPAMADKGLTLGMGSNSFPDRGDFNAGVMLLLPDPIEFNSLVAGITSIPHNIELAEQAYLNAYFAQRIYRLPFAYNSMVSMRPAIPTPWRDSEAIIMHYTCKPWHPYNCWRDQIEDLCSLWYMAYADSC